MEGLKIVQQIIKWRIPMTGEFLIWFFACATCRSPVFICCYKILLNIFFFIFKNNKVIEIFFCNYWNRYTKLKKDVKRFELVNAIIQLLTRIKMIIYRYKSLGFPVFDGSQCHHRFSALRKVSALLHILLISFYSVFHESGNLVKLYDCVSEFLLPLYM